MHAVPHDAIRSAIIQEMTHNGPMLLLSRQYHVTVQEAATRCSLKDRGMSRRCDTAARTDGAKRRRWQDAVRSAVRTGHQDVRNAESPEALVAPIRAHPGAWRIPESDDPGAVALSFARKAASAFLDEYGQAHVPVAHEVQLHQRRWAQDGVGLLSLPAPRRCTFGAAAITDIEDDGEIVLAS